MWNNLPTEQRDRYKKLITNFASLSEAFAQKSENDDIVAPIVNSKFQETAFQYAFDASAEDINNSSYDASINEEHANYLVGIKTFGLGSGFQKIAQFKKESPAWIAYFDEIRNNAKNIKNEIKDEGEIANKTKFKAMVKEKIDKANEDLYKKIALEIAKSRNKRIDESKHKLQGFNYTEKKEENTVESVYHVIMPSPKNRKPSLSVGEISYTKIDIDSLEIDGCSDVERPVNFKFHDKNHVYKYTNSDSQLYMHFNNRNIIKETWEVDYIDDALSFFETFNADN